MRMLLTVGIGLLIALATNAKAVRAQEDGMETLRQAQEHAKQMEKLTGKPVVPEFSPEEKKKMAKEFAIGLVGSGYECSSYKNDPSLIDRGRKMAIDTLRRLETPEAEAEAAVAKEAAAVAADPPHVGPDEHLKGRMACDLINVPAE